MKTPLYLGLALSPIEIDGRQHSPQMPRTALAIYEVQDIQDGDIATLRQLGHLLSLPQLSPEEELAAKIIHHLRLSLANDGQLQASEITQLVCILLNHAELGTILSQIAQYLSNLLESRP